MRMESQGLEEENDALEHHVRGAEDTTRTWLQNRRGGPRPGRSAVVMPMMAPGSYHPKQPGFGNSGRRQRPRVE